MSLTVSAPRSGNFTPLEDGTYLAVCCGIVDLGTIYNERYGKNQNKVMILWEIPGETVEVNGKQEPRILSARYTATLGNQGNLRRDLISWRGRDFTEDELDGFKLVNIVEKSCFLNVQNNKAENGKTYTNVVGVMALPKGTPKAVMTVEPIIFDFDTGTLADVEALPDWIADQVKASITYQKLASGTLDDPEVAPVQFDALDDSGDLPF